MAGQLRWDSSVFAYGGIGKFSTDGLTVTQAGDNTSVRATHGFTSGTHNWEMTVKGSVSGIRVGIVDGTFSTWKGSAIGNGEHGYGFYSGIHMGAWRDGSTTAPTFASGDTLRLTLTLEGPVRTLTATNVTERAGPVRVCASLPTGATFYPAASVYGAGNSVTLLTSSGTVAPVAGETSITSGGDGVGTRSGDVPEMADATQTVADGWDTSASSASSRLDSKLVSSQKIVGDLDDSLVLGGKEVTAGKHTWTLRLDNLSYQSASPHLMGVAVADAAVKNQKGMACASVRLQHVV